MCGGHFTGRPGAKRKDGSRPYYYGCSFHTSRGAGVCQNRTLLSREVVERTLLDLLLARVLTPATIDSILGAVNRQLRGPGDRKGPQLTEARTVLSQIDREIEHYTHAMARGDFASLKHALTAAEARRELLRRELTHLQQGSEGGIVQLPRRALKRPLPRLTDTLRAGDPSRVREAIETAIQRIAVGVDGAFTLEVTPEGLLRDLPANAPLSWGMSAYSTSAEDCDAPALAA